MVFRKRNLALWRPRALVVFGLIVVLMITVGIIREAFNRYQVQKRITDLREQVAQLGEENNELNNLINDWSSGIETEKQARLKLGLQKPGEKAVLIVKDPTQDQGPATPRLIGDNPEIVGHVIKDRGELQEVSNPRKWWQYFFN